MRLDRFKTDLNDSIPYTIYYIIIISIYKIYQSHYTDNLAISEHVHAIPCKFPPNSCRLVKTPPLVDVVLCHVEKTVI